MKCFLGEIVSLQHLIIISVDKLSHRNFTCICGHCYEANKYGIHNALQLAKLFGLIRHLTMWIKNPLWPQRLATESKSLIVVMGRAISINVYTKVLHESNTIRSRCKVCIAVLSLRCSIKRMLCRTNSTAFLPQLLSGCPLTLSLLGHWPSGPSPWFSGKANLKSLAY